MIERNPITGDPVIVAPSRADRPNLYLKDEACPFCPGNEAMTPPEIVRIGDPWRVRAFPNKYPATEMHEIVVETAQHDGEIEPDAVRVYIERYRAMDAAHITIFKNHGPMAGASIPHPHSQIIGTPFVPPRIEREAAAFANRCPLCANEEPVDRESEHFRVIAPRGAMFAGEQWIVPKLHAPEIDEPHELGELLRTMHADSFNWIFMNFPSDSHAHWYVQMFPRSTPHAGFELGTGSAIRTR